MSEPVNKIQLRENVEELTLETLIPLFRKPNMEKFVKIFTDELQLLEDTILDMLILRRLDNASGKQLDEIGAKLNVFRNNATDDQFKNIIKIRAFRRTSQGTQEDLLNMLQLFTGDQNVEILRVPPYGLTVTYNADCINVGNGVEELVKFFPLVTRLILQEKSTVKGFGFASTDDPVNPTFGTFASSTGLGNTSDNGTFVSLVYTAPDNIS